MDNYERLIIELLPCEYTPKAKYEYLQHLIAIKTLHDAAKEKLEFDLNWFGSESSRYKDAQRTYNVLIGIEEQPEETKPDLFQQMGISASPLELSLVELIDHFKKP